MHTHLVTKYVCQKVCSCLLRIEGVLHQNSNNKSNDKKKQAIHHFHCAYVVVVQNHFFGDALVIWWCPTKPRKNRPLVFYYSYFLPVSAVFYVAFKLRPIFSFFPIFYFFVTSPPSFVFFSPRHPIHKYMLYRYVDGVCQWLATFLVRPLIESDWNERYVDGVCQWQAEYLLFLLGLGLSPIGMKGMWMVSVNGRAPNKTCDILQKKPKKKPPHDQKTCGSRPKKKLE